MEGLSLTIKPRGKSWDIYSGDGVCQSLLFTVSRVGGWQRREHYLTSEVLHYGESE